MVMTSGPPTTSRRKHGARLITEKDMGLISRVALQATPLVRVREMGKVLVEVTVTNRADQILQNAESFQKMKYAQLFFKMFW